jgi:hypothetical protein
MSLPSDPEPDDQLLSQYLLGMLPETDEERLDELSIADDAFAARLDSVRHDLIDAYVRGNLRGDRLERFEVCFLSSPAMRGRIRFAEALLAYRPDQRTLGTTTTGVHGWRPLKMHWGLATAAALMLAVSGYLMLENARLRRLVAESASVQGTLQNRERELQRDLDAQRAAAGDAASALARARETVEQLQARAENPSAARSVVAFLLAPVRRGPDDVTTIAIPVHADAVTLRFEPEDSDSVRYRVAIRHAAEDRVLWRSADLNATTGASGTRTVTATLAAALLTPGTYVAELSGQARGGNPAESAGSYAFRVIRP